MRPIVSLISKSAKAQRKLAEGTWQHTMLRENLRALRTARAFMNRSPTARTGMARAELVEVLPALASMIRKTKKALVSFAPGTAHHTVQRNRLRALRRAKEVVDAYL